MSIIKFTSTVLKNKKGILKPDENGYYTMIIGGLNTYNSAGEYYVAKEAMKLFENSSSLMRRIKNGALYAELGHPKRLPGMSLEDFYRRVLTIDENNICAHISEVWLDLNYGKEHPEFSNPDLIAIMAKVKPTGTKAKFLEDALNSPTQNPAFSVRGLTDNIPRNNRVERILTEIVTWDYVLEPGINIANKWNSPVLENIEDVIVDKKILVKVAEESLNLVSTESSKEIARDIIRLFNKESTDKKLYKW